MNLQVGIKSHPLIGYVSRLSLLSHRYLAFPKRPTSTTINHHLMELLQLAYTTILHQVPSLIFNARAAFLRSIQHHLLPEDTLVKDR